MRLWAIVTGIALLLGTGLAKAAGKPSSTTLVVTDGVALTRAELQSERPLSFPSLDLSKTARLIDARKGDVTGDGVPDWVLLVNQRDPEMRRLGDSEPGWVVDMRLVVQDGATLKLASVQVTEDEFLQSGRWATMSLGDVDGDKVQDVVVSLDPDTQGGGGRSATFIHSFASGVHLILWDDDDQLERLREEEAEVIYSDGYRIEILRRTDPKLRRVLDARRVTPGSINELFDKQGKLKRPGFRGFVDPFASMVLKDVDGDGTLELVGSQYVGGFGHSDGIGMLTSRIKYDRRTGYWQIVAVGFEAFAGRR